MSKELVQRLRNTPLYESHGETSELPEQAADRIEALEAEIERLRIGISITDLRLTRIGDEAHVEVRIGGIWFRAITEQVDGFFDHIVSASCIRDIVRQAFPETVRAMGAALSPSDKGE